MTTRREQATHGLSATEGPPASLRAWIAEGRPSNAAYEHLPNGEVRRVTSPSRASALPPSLAADPDVERRLAHYAAFPLGLVAPPPLSPQVSAGLREIRLAEERGRALGLTYRGDVWAACRAMGIEVQLLSPAEMTQRGQPTALGFTTPHGKAYIAVRKGQTPYEELYTIGHELGHRTLHPSGPAAEDLCDRFAREFIHARF